MFDKKTVDLYKSITPSDDLRERVLRLAQEEKVPTKAVTFSNGLEKQRKKRMFSVGSLVSVAAAVCISVAVLWMMPHSSDLTVTVDGINPVSQVVEIPVHSVKGARTMAYSIAELPAEETLTVPLTINGNTSEITVSYGTLTKQETSSRSQQVYIWELSDITDENEALLTVKSHDQTLVFRLQKDTQTGIWTLTLHK